MWLIVSPSPAVPSALMPLPCRSTSAGLPAVLDTAQLPCSPLPPAKETKSDCLCPDGYAPRGNVPYIAATLAAATIFQTGSAFSCSHAEGGLATLTNALNLNPAVTDLNANLLIRLASSHVLV